jgi:hypothetical protein
MMEYNPHGSQGNYHEQDAQDWKCSCAIRREVSPNFIPNVFPIAAATTMLLLLLSLCFSIVVVIAIRQ